MAYNNIYSIDTIKSILLCDVCYQNKIYNTSFKLKYFYNLVYTKLPAVYYLNLYKLCTKSIYVCYIPVIGLLTGKNHIIYLYS